MIDLSLYLTVSPRSSRFTSTLLSTASYRSVKPLRTCSSSRETREQIDMLYMDFPKAFDCLSHDRLMNKMQAFGSVGKFQLWLATYLTQRANLEVFNGAKSGVFYPSIVLHQLPGTTFFLVLPFVWSASRVDTGTAPVLALHRRPRRQVELFQVAVC